MKRDVEPPSMGLVVAMPKLGGLIIATRESQPERVFRHDNRYRVRTGPRPGAHGASIDRLRRDSATPSAHTELFDEVGARVGDPWVK